MAYTLDAKVLAVCLHHSSRHVYKVYSQVLIAVVVLCRYLFGMRLDYRLVALFKGGLPGLNLCMLLSIAQFIQLNRYSQLFGVTCQAWVGNHDACTTASSKVWCARWPALHPAVLDIDNRTTPAHLLPACITCLLQRCLDWRWFPVQQPQCSRQLWLWQVIWGLIQTGSCQCLVGWKQLTGGLSKVTCQQLGSSLSAAIGAHLLRLRCAYELF